MEVVAGVAHRYFLPAAMSLSTERSSLPPPPLSWRLWLAVSAGTTLAGLGLSLVGQLGARGYTALLALGVLGIGSVWSDEIRQAISRCVSRRNRWKRAAPLGFACLGLAAFVGGALYSPVNYDTLWYRLPRVLHWLAEGRWHWIHTQELRFNVISTGMEWLWTPLVAESHSDRLLFLPNIISFFLLPGLVFSTFTRLGVAPRTAWWWMWILPSGWIYAFQAGSAANDAYSAAYALLMVDLALRARSNGRASEWRWAMLALALLTNAKQSNAPLGLLWLLAALPGWRLALQRPWITAGVALMAGLVSMIPTTLLNLHFTGHWMGWPREQQIWVPFEPWVAVLTNAIVIPIHNLLPPIIPGAAAWNDWIARLSEPGTTLGHHVRGFEFFFHIPKAITEARAGLGPLVIVLMVWTVWARRSGSSTRDSPRSTATTARSTRWIRWSVWPVLVLFLSTMGCREPARYLAAYYPFLILAGLVGEAPETLLRSRGWSRAVAATMIVSIALVIVSRQRPIFPTPSFSGWMAEHAPWGRNSWNRIHQKQLEHLAEGDRLLPVLDAVRNERVVGYAAKSTGELRLWQPLGSRRVLHVPPGETAAEPRAAGIRRVIVNDIAAVEEGDRDGMEWARKRGGLVVVSYPLTTLDAAARSARGTVLDLEGLARQRVKAGEELPVDNLYVVEIPDGTRDPATRTPLEPSALRQ